MHYGRTVSFMLQAIITYSNSICQLAISNGQKNMKLVNVLPEQKFSPMPVADVKLKTKEKGMFLLVSYLTKKTFLSVMLKSFLNKVSQIYSRSLHKEHARLRQTV